MSEYCDSEAFERFGSLRLTFDMPQDYPTIYLLSRDNRPKWSPIVDGDGRGVQGARRPDPPRPARRAPQGGRPDPDCSRAALSDDALRRDEAPQGAGGGRARHHETSWSREASLPEPRPDQARPRPLGEPLCRALGGDAHGAEEDDRGADNGKGVRDLHQDDPGAPLAGAHRSAAAKPLHLRRRCSVRLDAGLELRGGASWGRPDDVRREPRGRPAPPAPPELRGEMERGRRGGGHVGGDLGDRARRRLLPAAGDPRSAPRGRERRALRRLADDPLGPEDAAGDRRGPDNAGLADVRPGRRLASCARPGSPPARAFPPVEGPAGSRAVRALFARRRARPRSPARGRGAPRRWP